MKIRSLTLMAVLIALSAAGAAVTIPGFLGTPALDSAPGFVAGFVLGSGPGAAVAALGHLFTAGLHGFPFSLPVHLTIAAEMAAIVASGAWVRRRFGWVASLLWCVFANGLLAPALFLPWPGFGKAFVVAAIPQLTVASAINVSIATAVSKALLAMSGEAPSVPRKG